MVSMHFNMPPITALRSENIMFSHISRLYALIEELFLTHGDSDTKLHDKQSDRRTDGQTW